MGFDDRYHLEACSDKALPPRRSGVLWCMQCVGHESDPAQGHDRTLPGLAIAHLAGGRVWPGLPDRAEGSCRCNGDVCSHARERVLQAPPSVHVHSPEWPSISAVSPWQILNCQQCGARAICTNQCAWFLSTMWLCGLSTRLRASPRCPRLPRNCREIVGSRSESG
jgi:hypothetical protein